MSKRNQMNILVSGSIAYDSIMDFPDHFKNHILPDKIHNLNVSFLIDGLKLNYGGTAGNIAYNLSLLEETPTVISVAGEDFGKYKKYLEDIGVDCSRIKIISGETTAVAHIITDLGDNQITAFHPGAMKHSSGEIEGELLEDALAIIAPGNRDDMARYAAAYKKNDTPYIFDPGQQITALSSEELRSSIDGAKVFISNDYEFSLVLAKTGWTEEDILDKVEMLVTTLGEKGSVIKTKSEKLDIPPARVRELKDPTGAGDAYRAGFIKGLANQWPLLKTGRLASVVAAYAVETYGTQNHAFNREDVCERYKDNFGENLRS
jgi:adenosine kinase